LPADMKKLDLLIEAHGCHVTLPCHRDQPEKNISDDSIISGAVDDMLVVCSEL